MKLGNSYSPVAVGLFMAAGFFGVWQLLKELTISDRKIRGTLVTYVILGLLFVSSASWWMNTPPISKSITLYAYTLYGGELHPWNLSGNILLRHLWSPQLHMQFNAESLQKLTFGVGHGEPGSTITGELWLYPCKGIDVEKVLGQQAELHGSQVHHYILEFDSIPHGNSVAPLFPHFELKGKQPGWYPILYEIHAIVTDANGYKTSTGVVKGRFLLRLL